MGIANGASKAAVGQLTRAMAEAWSGQGKNVNALAPRVFKTELTEVVSKDTECAVANAAQTCCGRNGQLDELAGPPQLFAGMH